MTIRVATFNLENLDDPGADPPDNAPTLAARIAIMRPQLARVRAAVLCLQEVHGQEPNGQRTLAALESLVQGTDYENFNIEHATKTAGGIYDVRNLLVLSRFPITDSEQIRDSQGPRNFAGA